MRPLFLNKLKNRTNNFLQMYQLRKAQLQNITRIIAYIIPFHGIMLNQVNASDLAKPNSVLDLGHKVGSIKHTR